MIQTEVIADCYVDSVRLLEATRAMREAPGVDWAWALMATPANLHVLAAEGVTKGLGDASANDLVLAVRASNESDGHKPDHQQTGEAAPDGQMAAALGEGRRVLFEAADSGDSSGAATAVAPPASLDDALALTPDANVAIVSVPGPYAALEAHKALTRGLDVLLFSDNVPLADEIDLKRRARSVGRLVMGPGAGTAALGGTGLGFSNRVAPGPVGVVAAAGTGAQETMALLDRWGSGVTHVIGVGGRDLSEAVGGLMCEAALDALDHHANTELTLLVSKPPAPAVAERLLGKPRNKPIVAALIGLERPVAVASTVTVCNTLEQGVVEALRRLGHSNGDPVGSIDAEVARLSSALDPSRRRLVGLFSGGTLAYEAMTIASRHIGPVFSNTPLEAAWALPAPSGAHLCLDMGEEEFTVGRPHPMIDPEARLELLGEQVSDPSVAAVLLDVVIGDGAHPDPAAMLAAAAAEIVESGAAVVAYVLGTDRDRQDFERQRSILREAGCIVAETNARAALAASALVNRDPALVHHDLATNLRALR